MDAERQFQPAGMRDQILGPQGLNREWRGQGSSGAISSGSRLQRLFRLTTGIGTGIENMFWSNYKGNRNQTFSVRFNRLTAPCRRCCVG